MAKINDTTTYPNTAPALTDHVPGTDISNTTNDANGESVTFTMQAVMDLFEANFEAPTTAITSGTFADARISESSVTQHQAAITAGNVTTNANLTGHVTSTGNAAVLGSFTLAQLNTAVSDATLVDSAIASVAADTTPQLGGNLDVNGNSIVSTANGNITLTPNGTGNVVLGNYTLNADATVGAGQDDFYLRYDHSTGTWGPEAVAGGGGLSNVVEDTTPQLGGALDGQGFDLNNLGVAFLTEQAAAEVDVAGKGQIWVKSDTPNVLMFTDDAGTDATILTSESGSTLTSTTAVVAGDFVPIFDTSAGGDTIQRTWTNLFSDLSIVTQGSALGTPSSGTATNLTGLPVSTGISGLGTGVATALAVNVGSAGAPVTNGGALGTPSSGTLTSATGLPIVAGTTGTLSVARGGTGTTTSTGTGNTVLSASPTFTGTPVLPSTFTVGANNFVRSGAHALTLTTAATTNVTLPASGTLAILGANTFTGTQNFNGQQVEGMLNKVVTSVTGALTTTAHSGNILKTSGNVTVPTTAGFNAIIIAGGAHTVTFNATTSAAMATGDIMTVAVESATIIHAVLTAAADKVTFT